MLDSLLRRLRSAFGSAKEKVSRVSSKMFTDNEPLAPWEVLLSDIWERVESMEPGDIILCRMMIPAWKKHPTKSLLYRRYYKNEPIYRVFKLEADRDDFLWDGDQFFALLLEPPRVESSRWNEDGEMNCDDPEVWLRILDERGNVYDLDVKSWFCHPMKEGDWSNPKILGFTYDDLAE